MNFILHSLQSVLARIKSIETAINGESKLRFLVKIIKELYSAGKAHDEIFTIYKRGLNELYPLWIQDY